MYNIYLKLYFFKNENYYLKAYNNLKYFNPFFVQSRSILYKMYVQIILYILRMLVQTIAVRWKYLWPYLCLLKFIIIIKLL